MRGGRGVLMFFMPLCGCLSENVSVCECVCDCERESERERDGDLNKRKKKTSRECLCVSVFFQVVMPLAPNILQLWHLNDSVSIGHLYVCHGYGGQDARGRDKAFFSVSLCLYFFTILQHPHRDIPTASSPFPSTRSLEFFSFCTVSQYIHSSLVFALSPHALPVSSYFI